AARIRGKIGFAHAGDEMPDAPAICQGAREGEKHDIAAGNERRRQSVVADLDGDLAREGGLGDGGKRVEAYHMILAKAAGPCRTQERDKPAHTLACLEFGTMALIVVETDGFDVGKSL